MRNAIAILGVFAMTTLATADTPTVSKNPEHGAFVAHYLVKKKSGMSDEAFRAHQIEVHVPLVLAMPGLQGYSLKFFPPGADGAQSYDAMATVTFESQAAHDAALASEAGQRALADLPNIVEPSATVVLSASADDAFVGILASE
jgi:uncharacterized protein (TIGR02118 family)